MVYYTEPTVSANILLERTSYWTCNPSRFFAVLLPHATIFIWILQFNITTLFLFTL